MIKKPIGDFFTGTFNTTDGDTYLTSGNNQLRIVINSQVIPEPEEYALVFGLFALAFVLLRRYWQRKRQQSAKLRSRR